MFKKKETMSKERTRNWSAIMYPESIEKGADIWEWLEELKTPVLVSPLHDKDREKDGTAKKAHYHVILMFDSVKTAAQVDVLLSAAPAAPEKKVFTIAQAVNSISGMARYLIHLDNPEKYQYNAENVRKFGGATYAQYIAGEQDKEKREVSQVREIMEVCAKCLDFEEYVYVLVNDRPDLFACFRRNSYFFAQIINARARKQNFTNL